MMPATCVPCPYSSRNALPSLASPVKSAWYGDAGSMFSYSRKCEWSAATPESTTAHVMFSPSAVNERCAASTFTVDIERVMQLWRRKSGQMWWMVRKRVAWRAISSSVVSSRRRAVSAEPSASRIFARAASSSADAFARASRSSIATSSWTTRPSSRAKTYCGLRRVFAKSIP